MLGQGLAHSEHSVNGIPHCVKNQNIITLFILTITLHDQQRHPYVTGGKTEMSRANVNLSKVPKLGKGRELS